MEDEKRKKFIKLAENRVNRAIHNINLISNLANKAHYTYDEDDYIKIISALNKSINQMKSKFEEKKDSSNELFKL